MANSFATTRWSLVLDAAGREDRRALDEVGRTYWPPVYAFLRRRGFPPHVAEDLAQEVFAGLLAPGGLRGIDPGKGKFRAYLLACCQHVIAHRRDHEQARKRGGGRKPLPIDSRDAEGGYLREPGHDLTPEALFDRRWALALLGLVFDDLRGEAVAKGNAPLFDALRAHLAGDPDSSKLREIADTLGMTDNAVHVAAHRLRKRYREALRARIAATVDAPAEVDDEIRALFAAVATR